MNHYLKYMTWKEFEARRKTAKTVIIPAGACEVYGTHMPLGADILVAEKLAELVAQQVNGIIAPSVQVGQSKTLKAYAGTVAISAKALTQVYREIVKNFIGWGFQNYFVLNTHLDNTQPLNEVMEDLREEYGIRYGLIGWWQYIPHFTKDLFESATPHSHAGEAGTSTLLYLMPELVDMRNAVNAPSKFDDRWPGISKSVTFSQYTDSGNLGDAAKGSADKGKIIVERGVASIVDYIKNYLEAE